MNGDAVPVRDPLMLDKKGTETYSDQTFDVSVKGQDGSEIADKVRVRIVVLPDLAADASGTPLKRLSGVMNQRVAS